MRGRERARAKKNICGIITFLLHASLLLLSAPYNITASKLCDSEETLHLGKALLQMLMYFQLLCNTDDASALGDGMRARRRCRCNTGRKV